MALRQLGKFLRRRKVLVTCNHCGANVYINVLADGFRLTGNFTSELSQKCPEVIARGQQDGSPDHWKCDRLTDQIINR